MKKYQASFPRANDNEPPLGLVQELTEAETARELRISVDTLPRERAAGRISFARAGRRVFYPVVCIEQDRQDRINRCQATSSVGSARSRTGTPSSPSTASP